MNKDKWFFRFLYLTYIVFVITLNLGMYKLYMSSNPLIIKLIISTLIVILTIFILKEMNSLNIKNN